LLAILLVLGGSKVSMESTESSVFIFQQGGKLYIAI